MSDSLAEKYAAEGIDPLTNAFCLLDDKIYMTVAGMEIKAMRSGLIAGKGAVVFTGEQTVINPHTGQDIIAPVSATATYKRFCMDQICEFSSDPIYFKEYAKQPWHFEKPNMYLAKVARGCCLRHTVPEILAGVLSYEEAQAGLNFDKAPAPKAVVKLVTPVPLATPDSIKDLVSDIFGKQAVTI